MLIGTALILLQSPSVQTRVVEKVLDRINGSLGGAIEAGDIHVAPFNSFILRDVVIIDHDPYDKQAPADTFAYIRQVSGRVSIRGLFSKKGIYLSRAELDGGMMHLTSEPAPPGSDVKTTSNLTRIFKLTSTEKTGQYNPTPGIFQIENVEVKDFIYRMTSYTAPLPDKPASINWSDMEARVNAKVHSLKYTGGRMSGVVDMLSATEKCGYSIRSLTGRATVGMGKATLENVRLIDDWSDLSIPRYTMSWNDVAEDFSHFLENIRQDLTISGGHLSSRTINAYGGTSPTLDVTLNLEKCHASGYINDLYVDKFVFSEKPSGIKGRLSTRITGIPDSRHMLLDANVEELDFTTAGLSALLSELGATADLRSLAPGERFRFSGSAKGPMNNIVAQGRLSSGIGSADFDMTVRNLMNPGTPIDIAGRFASRDMGMDKLLGTDALGSLTASTAFSARLDGKRSSFSVDNLSLDKIGLLGYDYSGIKANGTFDGKTFNGDIDIADPNLQATLHGIFNFPQGDADGRYLFTANIAKADLQAINLDKRGTSNVSGHVDADITMSAGSNPLGKVVISDIVLENGHGARNVGDIVVNSRNNGGMESVSIRSGFLDFEYEGNGSYADILRNLQTVTTRRELPALYSSADTDKGTADHFYRMDLSFHDSRDILSFAVPGLYIADSTRLSLVSDHGSLEGKMVSSRLALAKNYLKGVNASFDNLGQSLNATVLSSDVSLGGVSITDVAVTAYAQEDNLFGGIHYDGIKGVDTVGEIYLSGDLSRDADDILGVTANPLSSYIRFNSQQWDIDESQITVKGGNTVIDGFRMHNGNQVFSIDGGLSFKSADTLAVGIRNLDMGLLNYFTKNDYGFKGGLNGRVLLSSPLDKNLRALANMVCDSLSISGVDAGTMRVAAVWDGAEDMINVYVRNMLDGRDALNASGAFSPGSKDVDLTVAMDGTELVLAKPFLQGFIDDISGKLSGYVTAKGTLDDIKLASEDFNINNAHFIVNYTGVPYTINGPLHLDNEGVHFDNITILDDEDGSAVLSGGINFHSFDDMVMNSALRFRNLKMIDVSHGAGISGLLRASGNVGITGPQDALVVNASISTAGDGNLDIPVSQFSSTAKSNLLTFKDHEAEKPVDPYEDMLAAMFERQEKKIKKGSDLTAKVQLHISPGLEATVDLDDAGGNSLKASGEGDIGLLVRPARNVFDLNGEYSISNGSYRFSIPGLVSKNFTINDGSSITFNGDLMQTALDIGATYSLRTNMNALVSDTTTVSTRRLVECGIKITDRLSAPKVAFSIDIPDLDPTSKAEIESSLNTEDKIQKQFVALLVTGSFLPGDQAGIVDNPNILYSNMTEMVSSQLSNMLERMNIPLDMGLGYQQSYSGANLFDLAVSTQLFNNRVVVNGVVGNRQYSGNSNARGDLVGDLDIDVKLNKSGNFRLNLFSHSADEFSSYLDYSQRNGGGFTYQQEFNTWKGFFRRLFSPRRRQEQQGTARPQREIPTVTVEIDE